MNISVNTLGVHVNPILHWKDQFEYVKNKMIVTIKKLIRKEMKACQDHMCFNTHILTNVFWV